MNEEYTTDENFPGTELRHSRMWRKFAEQIPSIIVTVLLVCAGAAWMYSHSSGREEAALAPLREQNEALRAQTEESRHQIEATTQLLREAIAKHEGELFKTDVEIQKLNDQRIDALADAIAKKVEPAIPGPKTAQELAKLEDEQVDKISSRTAEKLQPALTDINHQQKTFAKETVADYNDRIQHLNGDLEKTQAAAQDALRLSQEMSAMYLDSFKNHGVLARVISLPADLLRDTVGGNLIAGRDRAQAEQEISVKMRQIEKRLNEIQSQGTGSPVATN